VFAFFHQKGGVGKTTTAIAFAQSLADRGFTTQLVDMDAQYSASSFLLGSRYGKDYDGYVKRHKTPRSMFSQLREVREALNKPISAVTSEEISPKFYLVPGDNRTEQYAWNMHVDKVLSEAGVALFGYATASMPFRFLRANAAAVDADVVVIDLSPSSNILNVNLLMGADYWVVPLFADHHSVSALKNVAAQLPEWLAYRASVLTAVAERRKCGNSASYSRSAPKVICAALSRVDDEADTLAMEGTATIREQLAVLQKTLGYKDDIPLWLIPTVAQKLMNECAKTGKPVPIAPPAAWLDKLEVTITADLQKDRCIF
jgi:cellulose biosynthesis protein BcsQ